MKRLFVWSVLVVVVPSLVACGGGGDSTGDVINNGGGSTTLSASFVPDLPAPGPGTVSLQPGSSSGNVITVDAMVTDIAGVYSAGFDVVFNPLQVEFVGRSAGQMLESGGASVAYTAQVVGSNRVVVGVSRVGVVSTTDAVGSETLVRLTFRLSRSGSSALVIQNADLFDSQVRSKPNVTWAAGMVSATD